MGAPQKYSAVSKESNKRESINMSKAKLKPRIAYGVAFVIILALIVVIALFVRDRFIRPYGGDILITVLICCFVRIFFPRGVKLLPLWVFLFAVAVEVGQYLNIVDLLGLGHIPFFRIAIGTSFSWADILCYAAGSAVFTLAERWIKHLSR